MIKYLKIRRLAHGYIDFILNSAPTGWGPAVRIVAFVHVPHAFQEFLVPLLLCCFWDEQIFLHLGKNVVVME